jgi:hypothetical protein
VKTVLPVLPGHSTGTTDFQGPRAR